MIAYLLTFSWHSRKACNNWPNFRKCQFMLSLSQLSCNFYIFNFYNFLYSCVHRL